MNNRFLVIFMIFLICFTLAGCAVQPEPGTSEEFKYTLYIGLNDKDTYTQLLSTEEAENKASNIVLKHVDGFTRFLGKGAYQDEKGIVTYENSLVFEIYAATEDQIKAIMDELLQELNQSSILVERERVNCQFYEGTKP